MKPFLLTAFLFYFIAGHSQVPALPSWFTEATKAKGLDKRYALQSFLKPSFLQADFNGDASSDIAVLVIEKATKKRGVLLIHGRSNSYYLFGAGTGFGSGSDNYKWADNWMLYKQKTAFETQFDKESGDIIGGRAVKLVRPGILIEDYEDGAALAGGLIY